MRPRVILADDHAIVAEGVGRLIMEVADLVDRVANGRELVESARRHHPDIVVSDMTMPIMSGLDALRQLRSEQFAAHFIFLTMHDEPRLASEALRAGASGYVLKQAAGEELLDAIRTVMAGRVYLTPHLTRGVLQAIAQPSARELDQLTSRQLEVLRLIAVGKRMKDIAAELKISVRTVEDHKSQLMQTLGLSNNAELVRFALKCGLISE